MGLSMNQVLQMLYLAAGGMVIFVVMLATLSEDLKENLEKDNRKDQF